MEFRRWRANAAGVSGATVPRGISHLNREAVEGRAMRGSPPATASRFDGRFYAMHGGFARLVWARSPPSEFLRRYRSLTVGAASLRMWQR